MLKCSFQGQMAICSMQKESFQAIRTINMHAEFQCRLLQYNLSSPLPVVGIPATNTVGYEKNKIALATFLFEF